MRILKNKIKVKSLIFNGILDNPLPYDYLVNGFGSEVSVSQSLTYMFILIILFIIFALTVYGAIVIPFSNSRNEEGKIISINDLKYLKIVAYTFAYLELLFIVSIAKNIAYGSLLNEGIYSFFNILHTLMLISLIPFFPLLIAITIIVWLTDNKIKENMMRGL